MGLAKLLEHHQEIKPTNKRPREKRRDTTAVIGNSFNTIIAENFPSLEKGRTSIYRRLLEYKRGRTRKETPP
jgi:hypothetical protein